MQYTGKKTFSKKGLNQFRINILIIATMKEVNANGSIENEFWG